MNAVRATINWTHVKRYQSPLFQPSDVGIKLYSYAPGEQFPLTVNGGFSLQQGQATKREEFNTVYAMSDDLTLVKGSHQLRVRRPRSVLALATSLRPRAPAETGSSTAMSPETGWRIS